MSTRQNGQGGRRVYLVNPSFQLKVVGYTLLLLVLTTGIFYMSNLYFIWKFIDIGRSLGFPDSHPFFRFIVEQRRMMNSIFAITAGVTSVAVILGGVFFSHRVAGALHRLESHIDEVTATRELKEVSFRKGDYFSELAESFNRLMAALRETLGKNGK
jgi:hypothetical protein